MEKFSKFSKIIISFSRRMVRPFIAVLFTVATIYFTYTKLIPPEIIGTATPLILGHYFGERAALKKPGESKEN